METHHKLILPFLLFLAVAGSTAQAGDPANGIAGTWNVTITHDGKADPYRPVLKIKTDGEKMTGTMTRNTGSKIETLTVDSGQLKDTTVSFSVQFYSQVFKDGALQPPDTDYMSHWKFHGTVNGGVIKGTVEKESSAGSRTQDWEAKRVPTSK